MVVFTGTRSRNAVIKRMIEIGLIAERAEILQKNIRNTMAMKKHYFEGDDSRNISDDDAGNDSEETYQDKRPTKVTNQRKHLSNKKKAPIRSPKLTLNILEVQNCMNGLPQNLRENLEWIYESLNDAAEDAADYSDEPDDGVPLVPFTSKQRDALEMENFQKFLMALGLQAPAQNTVKFAFFLMR